MTEYEPEQLSDASNNDAGSSDPYNRDPAASPDDTGSSDSYNRDPAASPDDAGVPEVADDMTPGAGEVAEPERASMPTEAPVESTAHGMTAREQAEDAPLEDRLAAEEPDFGSADQSTGVSGSASNEEERPEF